MCRMIRPLLFALVINGAIFAPLGIGLLVLWLL